VLTGAGCGEHVVPVQAPFNREVVRLARSGEFGRVKMVEAFNGQTTALPEQWRLRKALAGGGALPDIGLYPRG
jgi:predicted dehydrogenase